MLAGPSHVSSGLERKKLVLSVPDAHALDISSITPVLVPLLPKPCVSVGVIVLVLVLLVLLECCAAYR